MPIIIDIAIALSFSVFWVSRYGYIYNKSFLNSKFINWFAASLWFAGLFLTIQVFKIFQKQINIGIVAIIFTWILYFFSLVFIEFVGYNLLKIRLITNEPPLFSNLIHGRKSLKFFYVSAGFWVIIFYFLVEELWWYIKYKLHYL